MKKFLLILTIILFLSGCMSSASPPTNEGLEPIEYENQEEYIQAYQFWNEHPMMTGNVTVINNTGLLDCDITTYNHAVGNLTIKIKTDGEVIYNETFNNTYSELVMTVLANTTIESYSGGYYDSNISAIADYFVIRCTLHY